jgi:hypothetical protein
MSPKSKIGTTPSDINDATWGAALCLLGYLPKFDRTKTKATLEQVTAEMVRMLPKWLAQHQVFEDFMEADRTYFELFPTAKIIPGRRSQMK